MALTKVTRNLLSTGIDDQSNAIAITIDSSERIGVGTTSPDFLMDIEGSNTQLKVGTASQDGGFLTSTDNNQLIASGGFYYDGSNFIAASTSASGVSFDNGATFFYNNSSLTDGNSFTLNEALRISSSRSLNFNYGTGDRGNRYITVNAGTSNDGGFILQRDNTNQWQIVNGTNDGDLILYSYGTSSTILTADRSTGNLGIGSLGADSQHRLKLTAGTGGARCLNMGTVNSGLCATTNNVSGTANYDAFAFTTSGGSTQVGGIVVGGSSTAYNTTSDYRLKENVDYTWDATTRLKQLRPARFNWIIDDTNTLVDGFLAHEVEDIVPEAITGTKDATETLSNVVRSAQGMVLAEGITEAEWTTGKANAVLWTEEDELPEGVSVGDVRNEATYPSDSTWDASLTKDVYQNIDQAKLVPLLVKTIQELEARITTLENA